MSVIQFPSQKEREQGPDRLERTASNLVEHIHAIQVDGKGGFVGFEAEAKTLTETTVQIDVIGRTDTKNLTGLGRAELQVLCDNLNGYLSANARPFSVSVQEIKNPAPTTFNDDYIQNSSFSLLVSTEV